MRLLDTTTKQLRTFYGEKIPKYAILSHMWGREEDEMLFRHIAGSDADKREGEMRKGYAKVEGACRQAVEDGWKYIWIDTCCIDKTSSAELSEAINSMYEWYRNSGVCYVYLEDVRSDSDGDGDHDSNRADEHDNPKEEDDEDGGPDKFRIVPFERSRWFKRGWTLQELIAPQFVVFYSKDWIDIGTKASLRETISAVAHIRVEMLMAYDPEKASVAEKISWAAFRKTTRVEDIAYCLMGLLGVNMPLLYGEGNRAFRRLQEELIKVSDDDSLFAWKWHFEKDVNYLNYACGMLAVSPWDFRDGMNIARSKDGAHSPYSMTNQGLQIGLPLLPIDSNIKCHLIDIDSANTFRTILKCIIRDKTPSQWIVVYLKKIREGHYQRIFPHWLDDTTEPLSVKKLISLLVPQPSTFPTRYHGGIEGVRIKILPTASEFTVHGHSLVGGYQCPIRPRRGVIPFKYQEKCFGVAIGLDGGIPWLDFIDVIDEKQSFNNLYKKGGSRALRREWHLDRLCKNIPGVDWWVTLSMKMTGHDSKYCFLVVIDIQRKPIQAKGWYNPPANDSFSGNFPLKYDSNDFKKETHNWIVLYNPTRAERKLDVSLVYTLGPPRRIRCVQVSCDGKYLARSVKALKGDLVKKSGHSFSDRCDMVQVYDMKTGAEICTFINKLDNRYDYTSSICFSLDNKFVAIGDSNGYYIKIWDIDANCMHKVLYSYNSRGVGSLHFLQSSSSSYLLISKDKEAMALRIWEIANGTSRVLAFTLPHENPYDLNMRRLFIAVSPDGRLVAGGLRGIIQIWDMMTTQLLGELVHHDNYVHVAFTPDGKGLVSGSENGTLNYWDISGLVCTGVKTILGDLSGSDSKALSGLARRDVGKINQPTITLIESKRLGAISSVAVSHDGRWVISKLLDARVVFWDLNDATPQLVLFAARNRQDCKYSKLAMSQREAGNMFATYARGSKVVRVWRYEPEGNPSSYIST